MRMLRIHGIRRSFQPRRKSTAGYPLYLQYRYTLNLHHAAFGKGFHGNA